MKLKLFTIIPLLLCTEAASMDQTDTTAMVMSPTHAVIVRPMHFDASDRVIRAIATNRDSTEAINNLPSNQLHSTRNSRHASPYQIAVAYLDALALRCLLYRGINPNTPIHGITPLVGIMRQCLSNRHSEVDEVISATNETEYTGQLNQRVRSILSVLIEYGADLTTPINSALHVMQTYALPTPTSSTRSPTYTTIGDFLAQVVSTNLGNTAQSALIEGLSLRRLKLPVQIKIASIVRWLATTKRILPKDVAFLITDYLSFLSDNEDRLVLTAENTIKHVHL